MSDWKVRNTFGDGLAGAPQGAAKVQTTPSPDGQLSKITEGGGPPRVRIPLGSPSNSPVLTPTAAHVGGALPPPRCNQGADARLCGVVTHPTAPPCSGPFGHSGAHTCTTAEYTAWVAQGASPAATSTAPVAGSPLVVPARRALDLCACADPYSMHTAGVGVCCVVLADDPLLWCSCEAFTPHPQPALVRMHVVPSTRKRGRLSVRLHPLDQLATPLIDALRDAVSGIAQHYADGDELELTLTARKVVGS